MSEIADDKLRETIKEREVNARPFAGHGCDGGPVVLAPQSVQL